MTFEAKPRPSISPAEEAGTLVACETLLFIAVNIGGFVIAYAFV